MEGVEQTMKIKYPYMRLEITETLKELSNREDQLKEWVDPKYAHAFWDTLMFSIHTLFDDIPLEEDPEGQIGYSLYNEEEVQVIKPLIAALNQVMDEIDENQPDEAYITSPLWDEVVRTAGEAYEAFKKNDELYDFQADLERADADPSDEDEETSQES